jgi:hypothetical protein
MTIQHNSGHHGDRNYDKGLVASFPGRPPLAMMMRAFTYYSFRDISTVSSPTFVSAIHGEDYT